MNAKQVERKLKNAAEKTVPNVLEGILAGCESQKGTVITVNQTTKNRTPIRAIIAAAACFLLLVGGALGYSAYRTGAQEFAAIQMDVNPGLILSINSNEKVLSVIPVNEDGKTVLGDMDLKGASLDVAVNALLGSMLRAGFITELQNSIMISVESDDTAVASQLSQRLSTEVQEYLSGFNVQGAVLSQTLTPDNTLTQTAQQYGITEGKVMLINSILANSPHLSFEQLAGLTVNELNLLLSRDTNSTGEESSVQSAGQASDKQYIGEQAAQNVALKHSGVSENTAMRVQLDWDDGRMVYDVEFNSGGYEYDYEIDAISGAIVESHRERLDKDDDDHDDDDDDHDDDDDTPQNTTQGISAAQAKSIAFKHAGVSAADVRELEVEFDYDDGVPYYEVSFKVGGFEYDYEIHSQNGSIIKSEKEAD